ncbi:MAG: ThuA domain-containing protein [Gemmataceae bacterium]|nr:ThuA domain-containing protein [Gemmata sp.]MDW8198175.1 ThuA domain-containing protein [Gemmataceae bacterium]
MSSSHRSAPTRRDALATGTAAMLTSLPLSAAPRREPAQRVLIVVGPSNHPPGTHEVGAGGRLLQHCVAAFPPGTWKADLITQWPREARKEFASVATVVFIGDLFPPEVMPDRATIMADLTAMMKAGCGIVGLHYATGLEAKHVAADGDHPLLHWMGGYFATRCQHHKSIARVFPQATIEPAAKDHPVVRGWKAFTIHDEPYINNYFGPQGPAKNVTALATAMLPPEKPQRETVAWAVERSDGGRGVGIVMPHFYRNWANDDLRTLILNAIVWTAQHEVPRDGMKVRLPELTTFQPDSVEPQPRRK